MEIHVFDIAAAAHLSGDGFAASSPGSAVVLSGERGMAPVSGGLLVHTLDAVAQVPFETRVTRHPGLVVHLVLDGPVHATVAGIPLRIGRAPGSPVRIAISALDAPAEFHRRAGPGEHLRKVNVSASVAWLAERGVTLNPIPTEGPLRQASWHATPLEVETGERILALAERDRPGARIEREALALRLLASTVARLDGSQGELGRRREIVTRMETFASAPGPVPSNAAIARAGGVSVSTMQRLFREVRGETARRRLRHLRLESAIDALLDGTTIPTAAWRAGYASPEAFATAFKAAFGRSPSEVR